MEKYHINRRGDAARCTAAPGGCPFAADENHYKSKEGARRAYEKTMEAKPITVRKIPHYTTGEKAFEGIPLVEEARIYRILTGMGVEYLPWRGREKELRDALRSYDETVKGSSAEGFSYGRSEAEASREALARYRATATLKGFEDKDCYALIKGSEPEKAKKPSLLRKIFSNEQ